MWRLLLGLLLLVSVWSLARFRCSLNNTKPDGYYPVHTYPYLSTIHALRRQIMHELSVIDSGWVDWPERALYATGTDWKVVPLCVFGEWSSSNCARMPVLTTWLKQVPGVRLSILSRLSAGSKLHPHQGWGKHSNHVLRCHYGLDVPADGCFVSVNGAEKQHANDQWIIFDDSELHSARNSSTTNRARVVLIVDLERPAHIRPGHSDVEDTSELVAVIDEFKWIEQRSRNSSDTSYATHSATSSTA